MIENISERIATWLRKRGAISQESVSLYSYAVYSFFFGLLPVFIVIIWGLALDMLHEGLVLITPFMLIRKFSGGYHITSSKWCCVVSFLLIAMALTAVKAIINSGTTTLLTALVVLSVICIMLCSPIDNKARKLTEKETIVFRCIAQLLAAGTLVVYYWTLNCSSIRYAGAFGVGIVLVAFLQFPEIIHKTIMRNLSES